MRNEQPKPSKHRVAYIQRAPNLIRLARVLRPFTWVLYGPPPPRATRPANLGAVLLIYAAVGAFAAIKYALLHHGS